ncbi:methionyl-tRNA formyltransferase [Porticoccaceae bacterium]|nr:methionyl-tRNA formyltransferase [Porticoccaceae bacterium]
MRVIFAGTPDFAATHLQAILEDDRYQLVAIYTQPDRPAGRGKKITQSPVKKLALANAIQLEQPASLTDIKTQETIARLEADVLIVVAYGLILPQAVLDIPRLGCINVHGSILPKWRGAAPIQRAIEAGDRETGVTVMQMDVGLDTGPMLTTSQCTIDDKETSASLYSKLAVLGAQALINTLEKMRSGTAVGIAQDSTQSSYADKIAKQESLIDWSASVTEIERRVRAFNPFPAAYSLVNGQRIKIWLASADSREYHGVPGEILSADNDGLLVKCGNGALLISTIQLAGKSKMCVAEALKSRASIFSPGNRLGT